ncbi:MAG: U32 family peptidase [Ruminococcus sp.]|nr:U32 family peptidase [Ruminococcus sp.]
MAKIEILAPAGGYDSVVAAVRSGADAVYVGEKRFSARASAKNFSDEELRHAVAYCHVHGVKVYVTLNTLVFDEEFEALAAAIRAAAEADADALIVQNMGVARLARQIAPELPLHASTQMSVHTASGVQALCEMGFKRVVLAREMSREEIKKAAKLPIELEVFVHGALCMSVSGQCYFSAMLGSRSGNRGACAQTCRLPFSVNSQKGGYALSLKDNSLIPHLADMQAIGIASAKIEGRMKRPEYVAAAVRACVEQRDFGFITDQTAAQLRGVFSRTGFTDGYYTGKRGAGMFGTRTRDDVVSADEKLLAQIRQGYKDEYSHVPLSGSFSAKIGERAALTLTDGAHTVAVFSECKAEPAQKVALTAEKCRFQLGKTGGTAYLLDAVSINIEEALSLPLAALNTMRREALEQMNRLRANRHHYQINNITIQAPEPYRPSARTTRVRIPKNKIGKGFRACEIVFVPLFSDTREWERLQQEGYPLGVEIPRGMFGREEQIERQLRRAGEAGVTHALCQNIGAVYVAKQLGFVLHGGFGLNLCNTYDLLWAEETGLADTELSLELTFERIDRLGGSIGRGIVSYGYLPLMLCRNCPAKSVGLDCKTCKNNSKMTDRKGKRFLLRCDGNSTEVLNCVPLYIAEKEISKLSTSFRVLRFTVENYVENVENAWEINDFSMLKDNFTRGLYKRGVL